MKDSSRKSVPEEKLEKVTGGGSFDGIPTVDVHEYDDLTKRVSAPVKKRNEQA